MVDRMTLTDLQSLHTAPVDEMIQNLKKYHNLLDNPMPTILRSAITKFEFYNDKVVLIGYSQYAPLVVSKSIFVFLSKLDGIRTWQKALQESNQEGANLTVDLIIQMFKQDMLCGYKEDDFKVGINLSFSDEDQVHSMIAPISEVNFEEKPFLD